MPSLPSPTTETAHGPRTRKPTQQRREQIVTTAAELFARRGYSGVGIDDIGAELGISGPALYRHIHGKESLLGDILIGLVDDLATASREVVAQRKSPTDTLQLLIAAVVDRCLDRPADVTVTLRSLWHVGPDLAAEAGTHWAEIVQLWAPVLRRVDPALDVADAPLYVRVGAGLLTGVARAGAAVPRARLVELATAWISAMLAAPLAAPLAAATDVREPDATDGAASWARSSRREQILDAAVELFREQGFRGVSMREIGAALGTSGSAAYRHFTSKEDILATALARANARMIAVLTDALSTATSAEDALDRLLRSSIQLAVDNPNLVAVATSEGPYLSDDQRAEAARTVRMFSGEWVHCVTAVHPELSAGEARVLVRGLTGMIAEAARSRRMARRADLADDLYRLSRAVLSAL